MKEMNGKISPKVFDSIHSVYPKLILKTYDQLMASANPVGNMLLYHVSTILSMRL